MDRIHDLSFGGERPLFGAHDTVLENITITDGESGIKCCHDLECHDSKFYGKYPWWHVDRSLITSCYFAPESRSAIWYSNDMKMKDCVIDGPKFFREMHNLELENVTINDADETFWRVDGLKVKNVTLHQGTYPFMFCKNVYVDGLTSDAKYVFQYCENVEVHNAKITTKDSFWNHHEGQLLGVQQCHRLRLGARRRVPGLAQQKHQVGALPYQRRATAVLYGSCHPGGLHLRQGMRPCL